MRGGYSSASSYGMYVNGTGGSQWARTMDQSGPYGQIQAGHQNLVQKSEEKDSEGRSRHRTGQIRVGRARP